MNQIRLTGSPLLSLPPPNSQTPPPHFHSHSPPHCPKSLHSPPARSPISPLLHSAQRYLHSCLLAALQVRLLILLAVALQAPALQAQATLQSLTHSSAIIRYSMNQIRLTGSPLLSLPPLNSQTPPPHFHSHSPPHCLRLRKSQLL